MKLKTRNSLFAICISLVLVAGVTIAAAPTIQVGAIRSPSTNNALAIEQFKNTVHESVSRLDTTSVRGGPFVFSASLVRMTSESGEFGVQATAVIKTALVERSSGALIGASQGMATAAAPGGNSSEAQRSALRAAMRSAIEGIPSALRAR